MDMDREKVLEAKIAGDIVEFLDLGNLDELVTVDEIYDGVDTATKLSKSYRDVHTELKFGLEDEYAGNFQIMTLLY